MDNNVEMESRRLQRLVNRATDFRRKQRDTEYINNEAHYEGLHWKLAETEADSPFIVKSDINHLKNAVDIRLGSLFADTYYGMLKPLSQGDVETVENLNILYRNEWFRLDMDKLIEKAIKAGAIFDNGYIEFGFDTDTIVGGTGAKREGVITANFLDTANVYLDPSAESLDSCNYYVKKMKFTNEELKRDHKSWYKKLKENNRLGSTAKESGTGNIFVGRDYTSYQDNVIVVNAVYEKYKTKVEIPLEESTQMFPEMAQQVAPEQATQIANEIGLNTNKEDVSAIAIPAETVKISEKVEVTRVKVSYIVDDIILEINTDYPFDEFSIIPFQWESAPQTPYGTPLLRGLTVPQKVANLIESSINNIAVHYTIPTWIISDDSGLDVDDVAELINALGVVWKVNDINTAIKQLEPPKINSDIIQMGQTFVNYIKEYCGVTSAYYGNIGTAGSTAEGTQSAINRATVIDNNPLGQIEDFVERLTRMLIKFMTRYYAGDTMYIREDVDTNKYRFNEFVIDSKFDDINYDFDVDLGSRSKTDKNRQYNMIKDIYQLQNQYHDTHPVINVADVVKAAQLDNYDEIQNRLEDRTEEVLQEKATLIVQLMQISNTLTPNGTPLINEQRLSDGIMDVLNDDNDLSTAEGIIQEYEEYQNKLQEVKQSYNAKMTELQNQMFTNGQVSTQNQGQEQML